MLVWNAHRTLAVVIKHDGRNVRLVVMKQGRLGVTRLTRERFEAEWSEAEAPFQQALATFLVHAHQQGASGEAMKGLDALARRDACVVDTLF